MAEGALVGSTIAYNHAWIPYEKSMLNDIRAALECHRLHPRYWPLLTLTHDEAGTARTRAGLPISTTRGGQWAPLRTAKMQLLNVWGIERRNYD
jgi:hypothetical protein